jgi:hypothetical protein
MVERGKRRENGEQGEENQGSGYKGIRQSCRNEEGRESHFL